MNTAQTAPDRTLLAAERAVLGSALLEPQEALPLAAQILAPAHFATTQHAEIWAAMLAMQEGGTPIDLRTLGAELARRGSFESSGGWAYLNGLDVPTAAHIERYARDVLRAARTREQIRYLQRALYAAQEPDYEPDEGAGAIISHLTQETDARDVLTMSEVLLYVMEHADDDRNPLRTGAPSLDRWLDWLDEDGVVQLAATAGTGKTAAGMQMLLAEVRAGGYALMFSAEMGKSGIGKRILTHLSGANLRKQSRHWTDDEAIRFARGMELAGEWGGRWWLDDTPGIAVDLLVARARLFDLRARREQEIKGVPQRGLGVILVDYLQTLDPPRGEKSESLEKQVTEAGKRLTALAHRLNTRVVIITSLSNQGTTRYSGAVDFQVDARIYLEREKDSDLVEARIVKARDGETGTCRLRFDGKRYTYTDWGAEPWPEEPPDRSQGRRVAEERGRGG